VSATADGLRRPGRPRLELADAAILAAARNALLEEGYAGFTVDRIAARAGVARATIYRRWSTKFDLLTALLREVRQGFSLPDTGALESDLRSLLGAYVNAEASIAERVIAALASAAFSDPELSQAVREEFVAPRRQEMLRLFERAVTRGEVNAGVDLTMLVNVTWGFLWQRRFIVGLGIDQAAINGFVRTLSEGIHAA
jgi:AcrR family transcriptional regulator